MTWQPIETAPKDGRQLLLCDGSVGACVGGYLHGEWQFWDGDVEFTDRMECVGVMNSWLPGHAPTHWMPLPEPPVTA